MRQPMLVLVALLMVGGSALAACSEGQMTEAQLQFQGAQALLRAQQWEQAIPQLQSIIDFCPEYFPALRGLGLAHSEIAQVRDKAGSADQAAASYDLAATAYSKVIAVMGPDSEASDYANLAKVYTRQKKYREARAEYLKAQARDPNSCAVLVNLGILHNASGYPNMAVDTLEDALANCPDLSPQILPQLTKACTAAAAQQRQIGNAAKAVAYEQKASSYGGSAGGTTAYQQVQQAMQAGDYAAVIAKCDQVLAQDPLHANAWLTKARAADAINPPQRQTSIDAYREYLKLRPENIAETSAMIIVMAEAGQCDQAVAEAKKATQHFAGLGAKALGQINFAYGKALFCAKDYSGAKAQFQRAAASGDPKWVEAGRDGLSACDEYINYEAAQNKKAGN